MRAVNDGLALARERLDERLETHGGIGVQPVERLVEKDDGRIVQQRSGDHDLAPHAFRVSAEQLVRQRLEAEVEERNELPDALAGRLRRNGVERGDHLQIFQAGERLEHRAGFRHEADDALHLQRVATQVQPTDRRRPFRGLDHPCQHLQRGGFAGAVRPEEADDLSARDLKRQRVNGRLRTKTFGELVERNHRLEQSNTATHGSLRRKTRIAIQASDRLSFVKSCSILLPRTPASSLRNLKRCGDLRTNVTSSLLRVEPNTLGS